MIVKKKVDLGVRDIGNLVEFLLVIVFFVNPEF
jgi:hypothetical protein